MEEEICVRVTMERELCLERQRKSTELVLR